MALSVVNGAYGGGGQPPPSVAAPAATSVGDFLLGGALVAGSTAVLTELSDNVNSGNYTAYDSPVADSTNNFWLTWTYKIANASGTPTLSATWSKSAYGNITYARVTGFAGTPTVDTGLTANFSASATTAVSINAGVTARAGEVVVILWKSGSGINGGTPSGWTEVITNNTSMYYRVYPTAGTAVTFTGTMGASSYYDAQVLGVYDLPTGPSLTSVNSNDIVADGATAIPYVGVNLGATTGAQTVTIVQGSTSVAQTQDTASTTGGTFDFVLGGLQFGAASFEITVSGTTGSLSITVNPPTGQLYVNIGTPNTTATNRIQTSPNDLVAGDQVWVRGVGGTAAPAGLVLSSDGTFDFQSGYTPVNFEANVWDSTTSTWGSTWALQNVEGVTITIPSGLIPALQQFFSLLPS